MSETAAGAIVPVGDVTKLHTFILRKNFFKLFGQTFRIYDPDWSLLLVARLKAFKLKEDIRVYADEAQQREILAIKARQMIDFNAAYDVFVTETGARIGALRRKGWASLVRDKWAILDADDKEVGWIEEDSLVAALIRRLLVPLIPQTYSIHYMDREVGEIQQHFNPFIFKATMDLTKDPERKLSRLLAIAASILIMAIEGRQE
jgi:hypothetical protein